MGRVSRFLSRWLRWQPCRGVNGCSKMLLLGAAFPIPFDCYLFRYLDGAAVSPHRDPLESGRHYRLNVVLRRSPSGGEFVCSETIFSSPRVKLFRPDVSLHSVSEVRGGSRYVLSLGWILR